MATLCGTGLGKRYGTRAVFRDLNFEVIGGTIAAIVGANGAGKSTLLRIISGLIRPTLGQVEWHDDYSTINQPSELSEICGLAAPDAPLYRELTAMENVEFFARSRGLTVDSNRLGKHLAQFGLGTRTDDLAGDLSSGLRARLGLAVATLHEPPVLLLDEPAANLDEAGREILQRVLDAQRTRGIALVATNDSREAATYDKRIVV
jgi:heme exporter protein A